MVDFVDLPNQDAELQQMPSDILRDLAENGKNNLFFMAKGILRYNDMTEGCHGPFCTWLDENKSRFKLGMMPRGHYKTTVATKSRQLQKVCRNPENRLLLANETSTNAERFLGEIKSQAEQNIRFRTLYSHLIPKDYRKAHSWSQQSITFNREGHYSEPSIDTIGMTGAWTSRHYTHITFDDPISEEAAKSEKVMTDVIDRVSKVFSLMTDVEHDTFDLIGTRWAFHDLYTYMMKWLGPKLAMFIRGAIEEGQPIFPEKFSLETLALIRNSPEMGEYNFACQYMNNPRNPELQDFNVNDLRFWRWSSDRTEVVLYGPNRDIVAVVPLSALDVTVTVDPAAAERTTSDRNGLVVCGTTLAGDVVVLEALGLRCKPQRIVAELIRIIRQYAPRAIGVEKAAYQMSLKYWLEAECTRESLYANVVPVKPGGPQKAHIRGLQPVAATGHLYIDPTQHILRNELADYPLGQHDDVADALALQQQLWPAVLNEKRWERYKMAEARLLRDIDGYGLRSEQKPGRLAGAPTVPQLGKVHPRDVPHPDDIGYDPEFDEKPPIYEVNVA